MKSLILKIPSNLKIIFGSFEIIFVGNFGKSKLNIFNNLFYIEKNINYIKLYAINLKFLYLYKKLILNNIFGVLYGFNRRLKLKGLGYFFKKEGFYLVMHLGYSHNFYIKIPNNINIIIRKKKFLFLFSDSLENISLFCSYIRSFKIPDCYKGKGIIMQYELIKIKEGKKLS